MENKFKVGNFVYSNSFVWKILTISGNHLGISSPISFLYYDFDKNLLFGHYPNYHFKYFGPVINYILQKGIDKK